MASGHVGAGRIERLPSVSTHALTPPPRMPPQRAPPVAAFHVPFLPRTATVMLSLIAKLVVTSGGSEGEHEKADSGRQDDQGNVVTARAV